MGGPDNSATGVETAAQLLQCRSGQLLLFFLFFSFFLFGGVGGGGGGEREGQDFVL